MFIKVRQEGVEKFQLPFSWFFNNYKILQIFVLIRFDQTKYNEINMKNFLISFFILLFFSSCKEIKIGKLQSFGLSDVKLLESPFYQAQQTDLKYILELNPDRLLAPYLIDAGFKPLEERYVNWENTGLDGHIGGHYLSSLAFMYASTGNEELLGRINYMINWLARCQEKNGNGYTGGIPGGQEMWKEVASGNINAGNFSLNEKWVPLYNIHKLYAGLRDVYQNTGNKKALEILINLSDWCMELTKDLSDEQMQEILKSEHGGMNEIFVDVAEISGDEKYLMLAERFSHKLILEPLIQKRNELTGLHANTQIPKVIGFKRYADATNNNAWSDAADFFWNTVVGKWTVSIGGNSVREHFHPADDFSSMVKSNQGPETCNTYNMLRLTKLLFLSNPDNKYIEYYERALYNHILSSEHPTRGGFVYFTPMRPGHYRVYSQPQQCFWCCVGSGLENHGKYGEMIYAHGENDLYVNLFIASVLNWEEKGIILTQNTKFPYQESSELELQIDHPQKFAMKIRKPLWVNNGEFKITVNGKKLKLKNKSSSWISIYRKWKTGDIVKIALPMQTQIEYLPDNSPWASIIHGPIVLAAIIDSSNLEGIWADSSRMGHVANGPFYPLDETPVIVSDKKDFTSGIKPVEGKPLTFQIPELLYPEKYKNLKLKPFFDIHEARYIIYWPVASPEDIKMKN